MRSTEIVTETREVTKIIDIKCNKCGETCQKGSAESPDYYGLIEPEISAGYYSTHLSDGCTYSFSLCERCLDDLFQSFKLPVSRDSIWPEDALPPV